jgi:hypothetical protein
MNFYTAFAMTHFMKLYYNVFILKKQDWCTSVQKNLCQFVLYLVGNCINLCQFGEGFLLVKGAEATCGSQTVTAKWAKPLTFPRVHGEPPCHGGMGHHHGIPFPALTRSPSPLSMIWNFCNIWPRVAQKRAAHFSLVRIYN